MKNVLVFLYCCMCSVFLVVGYASSATAPELKIPLDCYYIKAPDGDRLDNYLNKNKDKVWRKTITTDGTSPYTIRVLAQSPSSLAPSIVKVSAFKNTAGNACFRSAMIRGSSLQYLLSEQNTTGGDAVLITMGFVSAATVTYVDVKIYNCENGTVFIEVEKL
ncbi:MAG: hypothetical protein PHY48_17460 [Candidatus Cloacimonetes bacterium]|nr:hypothetical protein [Candidatus Cloacimonadota bacterium]